MHSYTKTFFKRETNIILECPKTLKPIFHCFTSLNGYCENNSILQIHMHCIFPSRVEVWYWTQKPYKKCNWILIFITTYQYLLLTKHNYMFSNQPIGMKIVYRFAYTYRTIYLNKAFVSVKYTYVFFYENMRYFKYVVMLSPQFYFFALMYDPKS